MAIFNSYVKLPEGIISSISKKDKFSNPLGPPWVPLGIPGSSSQTLSMARWAQGLASMRKWILGKSGVSIVKYIVIFFGKKKEHLQLLARFYPMLSMFFLTKQDSVEVFSVDVPCVCFDDRTKSRGQRLSRTVPWWSWPKGLPGPAKRSPVIEKSVGFQVEYGGFDQEAWVQLQGIFLSWHPAEHPPTDDTVFWWINKWFHTVPRVFVCGIQAGTLW